MKDIIDEQYEFEDKKVGYPDITKDVIKDPYIPQFPGEDEIIQRQRNEQRNRLAEQREHDRLQKQVTLEAEAEAERLRQQQANIPPPEQHGGGGGYRGDPGGGTRGSPFKKGGRIDKALGGRSRDI